VEKKGEGCTKTGIYIVWLVLKTLH